MMKTILGAAAVLAVLLLVYLLLAPSKYTSTEVATLSPAFQKAADAKVDEATRIVLEKGKGTVELKKEASGWVVASSHGYPADKERVDKLLKTIDGIRGGEKAGESAASHANFEVDKKKGGFITVYGKDGAEIAKIVAGKTAAGGGINMTRIFARFGDEDTTWRIESDVRSDAMLYGKDAEAKNYLFKDIVKLPDEMEIESVRLIRPEQPDIVVERKYREVPADTPKDPGAEPKDEEKKDETEKKPETRKEEYFVVTSGTETLEVGKSEEWTARGLVNRGKTFSIDGAEEPKDLAEYGLDKPQLKVVYTYRKKDAADDPLKTVTVLFGNAKKDGEGESKSYYAMLEDEAHKGRIYVVEGYKFDGWKKEMKDFLPKPKEEEKPVEEPKPGEAPPAIEGAPAPGTPAPPGGAETPNAPDSKTSGTPVPGAPPQGASLEPAPAPPPGTQPPAPGGTPPAGQPVPPPKLEETPR